MGLLLLKFSMLFLIFFFRNGFSTLELAYKCFLFQSVSITLLIIAIYIFLKKIKINNFIFFLMENLMKMMTIIVWGLYDETSQSYEFSKKKKIKKLIFFFFFNEIFSTDLSQVG